MQRLCRHPTLKGRWYQRLTPLKMLIIASILGRYHRCHCWLDAITAPVESRNRLINATEPSQ